MSDRRLSTAAVCVASLLSFNGYVFAAGGTLLVATKGEPAYVSLGWHEGVGELVNDSSRTSGWNAWFSEWPNDVNHYAFEIDSTDALNRLIAKFAMIKTDALQIRLSHLKEPRNLGWVTQLPEGNGISVIFSIGYQHRINEWFQGMEKPFGKLEFTATPEAVPPTLTIFVQDPSVSVDQLAIPEGIDVSRGYVSTVFHKFNTTSKQQRETDAVTRNARPDLESPKYMLDRSSVMAAEQIEAFLASRRGRTTSVPK